MLNKHFLTWRKFYINLKAENGDKDSHFQRQLWNMSAWDLLSENIASLRLSACQLHATCRDDLRITGKDAGERDSINKYLSGVKNNV